MTLLDRLERRFGRYAVENVTLYLVLGQGFVYLASAAPGAGLIQNLVLVPSLVLQGEVWRLFTFVLTPPSVHPLLFLIYLSAFYFFGNAVEQTWGSFRYNVYLLIGFAATAAAGFVDPQWPVYPHYVKTSVFLAFATLLPDYTIHLYMILPVKARWLAGLTWALYAYAFYVGGLSQRLMIAAAITNFVLFFAGPAVRGVKQTRRRQKFQSKVRAAGELQHECRVCGLTSKIAPKTAFRYCSKCAGQCCYCPDHIRNHECVVDEAAEGSVA